MKKTLLNKFTLKILSVLIAMLIWLLVTNIKDPIITKPIKAVVVTMEHENYIESLGDSKSGKVPMMEEGKNKINVYVRGKKSVVNDLTEKDVTAVADLQQIVDMDTDPVMVPVTVTCPGVTEEMIETKPKLIPIKLEDKKSVDKPVTASIGEAKPAKGYEVGTMVCDPEKVTISGPESIINIIDKVIAPIDEINGMKEDTQLATNLKILDKNGSELQEDQMKALSFVDNPGGVANVAVDFWEIKQDIKIKVNYNGKPKKGYRVSEITTTPETITLAGSEEAWETFAENGNTLNIPEELLSVEGEFQDFEQKLELADLIPHNMKQPEGVKDTTLFVKISVLRLDSKEYNIPTTKISIVKPEGMTATAELDKINVRVSKESGLPDLEEADILLSINLADYQEGEFDVPISVQLPNGYQILDPVTVKIKLSKAADAAETSKKTE